MKSTGNLVGTAPWWHRDSKGVDRTTASQGYIVTNSRGG
ncbi:hypothetical protein A2U01_0075020 [Trifolium medium]|uniref:Uncharacterized protein n=1 Tax=Trifolium medium TaxID=97028 RepID=A0A392SY71_9FABA|nr:hypothetical protein [Trifolium medium]